MKEKIYSKMKAVKEKFEWAIIGLMIAMNFGGSEIATWGKSTKVVSAMLGWGITFLFLLLVCTFWKKREYNSKAYIELILVIAGIEMEFLGVADFTYGIFVIAYMALLMIVLFMICKACPSEEIIQEYTKHFGEPQEKEKKKFLVAAVVVLIIACTVITACVTLLTKQGEKVVYYTPILIGCIGVLVPAAQIAEEFYPEQINGLAKKIIGFSINEHDDKEKQS